MVTSNDDRQEFPDGISTSSKKAKQCFSLEPCRISSIQFPEEMLYEVFLRLPVKSLYRFRSVSKGMRGLIHSSVFIRNHNIYRSVKKSERAAAAAAARSLSVGQFWDDDDDEYAVLLYPLGPPRFLSLKFDSDNMNHGEATDLNCNVDKEGMDLMGRACNGIFCFFYLYPQRFIFWNPSNATVRKVDCSSFLNFRKFSMGYDIVNNDYKVIGFINNNASEMQVYSLRTDSWKKLFHRDFPSGRDCCPNGINSSVCVGGIMHWMWTTGNQGDVKSIFIIAFNLATETFTTSLPLPSEARQLQLRPCHFTDFRGRVCVTFYPPDYPSRTDGAHTMWVMQKNGVESCWSRLYDFNIDVFHSVPNCYFPNSRGRLLSRYRQHLCWWDPQEGTFERIDIPGLLNASPREYVRNLIRLDQSLV